MAGTDSDVVDEIKIADGVTAADGGFVLSMIPSLPDWVHTMIESEGASPTIYAAVGNDLIP